MWRPVISLRFENISIAFDLDGTLVDTARDLIRVLNAVIAPDGVPPVDYDRLMRLVGYGSRALITRAYAEGGVALSEARCDVVQKEFLDLYAQDIAQLSVPYPGVLETLALLKRGGAALSVCTNKPGYLARPLLQALDMTQYFDRIVGGDEASMKKPAPAHIFEAVGHRGRQPIWMVGDGAPDIQSAKAAKTASIVMSYGYSPVSVDALGADYVLRRFRDIPAIIIQDYARRNSL